MLLVHMLPEAMGVPSPHHRKEYYVHRRQQEHRSQTS